ncbi:oligosaccharide flippase family protein [Pontibacter sp. E15-1]|uniref:oligosaccharide flippase family protein n=1 Tax=Pontibacter sp. E15-1 TaxID=2919918 RepID=UPI001F50232A|nr:oligosaccharide flippase family protein [Pontibacter sp. E15-1]MCJ8166424.1 oligosaccharide flippase family protein [Pontibacter sp. E15-1]
MIKKLFSHSIIYALGPQIPKVAGIFILPLITKYLTAADYGIIGVVTAYTGLLSGLQDLGIAVPMVNTFYKHPKRWKFIWRQFHGFISVWSVVFAFLQAALLYAVIPEEAYDNRLAIILLNVVPIALFSTTINFCSRYYQFAQKPLYISFVSALVGIITMVLNIVTIVHFELGYLGWMLSSALSTFISFVLYAIPLYYKHMIRPILRFNRKYIYSQLKVALPTIPHNYSAYLLNSSDRMVMDILGININKLGLYNLAYTFGNYFEFGGNAVGMAVGPLTTNLMAEGNSNAEEKLRNLIFFLQIGFISVSFLVCLWCKELFQLLINNVELQQAYGIAIIIIMGYNYRPMYWAVINRLCYFEKTQHLWKISLVAGILNVVLNFIFIPIYGYMAAAYTTFVSLLVIGFSGFLFNTYKETTVADIKYQPLFWLVLIIAFTGIVLVLKDTATVYKIAITVLTLVAALIAARKYAPVD